jgi:hypothetical protein
MLIFLGSTYQDDDQGRELLVRNESLCKLTEEVFKMFSCAYQEIELKKKPCDDGALLRRRGLQVDEERVHHAEGAPLFDCPKNTLCCRSPEEERWWVQKSSA